MKISRNNKWLRLALQFNSLILKPGPKPGQCQVSLCQLFWAGIGTLALYGTLVGMGVIMLIMTYQHPVVVFSAVSVIAITLGVLYSGYRVNLYMHKEHHSVVIEYLKAAKRKVCPLIDVED